MKRDVRKLFGTTFLASAMIAPALCGQAFAQELAAAEPVLDTEVIEVTGDRDPGTTEGTDSYTGRALSLGKLPTSLRETPQSVSVITRERLEDQMLTDVGDALRYTTGMQVFSVGGDYTSFSAQARGATADYQIDGLNQLVDDRAALFDLSLYDRIEVLRGPAGLFKGAGSAGATVNMVRKRALSATQIKGAIGGGSWGTYRAEADVTGALNESGTLRGRLVGVTEKRGTHLYNSDNKKHFVYGTLEFDLGPDTTLSAGGAVQQADMDYFFGLPAFANGAHIDVPRSTSFTTDWAVGDLDSSDYFVELEHRFQNGGFVKGVIHRTHTSRVTKQIFSGGGLQANGTMAISTNAEDIPTDNTAADVYVTTPFTLWGLEQNFLVGADYSDARQITVRRGAAALPNINIFTFDPATFAEPAYTLLFADTVADTKSYGVYSQLRVKPIEQLTLIGGARFSWRELANLNRVSNARTTGPDTSGKFTPYVAAVFDVTSTISTYGSMAEIFQPQTATTVAGALLPPVTGRQFEVGVKGEFMNGALNAHAAVFRTVRSNEALPDPVNPGFSVANGKRRVQGIETEVSGRLAQGWDISAGYAYNNTKILVAPPTPFFSSFPSKHVVTLWSNYTFEAGAVRGLEIGGGVRALSDFYNLSGGVRFEGKAYTIAAARVGYKITQNLDASFNVENLFDKTYRAKVGNTTANNYYGAPRSFMVTLRATY